jgi:hypothetical protein
MWPGTAGFGCAFVVAIADLASPGDTPAMSASTTLVPIGEPKPVVASHPVPAENPVISTGLLDESNSSAELLPVVMS